MTKRTRGSSDYVWRKEKILQLIGLFESNSDLWDVSSPLYSHRGHKKKLQNEIAAVLEVDVKDVAAKLHNLRCQYNSELRKIKTKNNGAGSDEVYVPRWEYFNALHFLVNTNQSSNTSSNLDTTEEEHLNLFADLSTGTDSAIANETPVVLQSDLFSKKKTESKQNLQEDIMMNNAMKILSTPADSHQIFGDYVAEQMRGMNESKRKRLKIIIQKAIIKLEEEPDDTFLLTPGMSFASSTTTLYPLPKQYSKNLFGGRRQT